MNRNLIVMCGLLDAYGEVDFCGHATLVTFSTLFQQGFLSAGSYVQRTKAGMRPVTIEPSGSVVIQHQLPQKINHFSYHEISSLIGISSHILESTKLPIEVISMGLPDAGIPAPNGYLNTLTPSDEQIAAFRLENTQSIQI
ncbi:PhzF family phenazine biosynthesis protein [Marinomonas sp. 2405UD68-3]|uniref:PhzF family phenazine biosynthesis protein n=1 Tax=Marinomonas sp. 2405UD68-3 TaxID=3391835 RepID=UPI0039C9BB0A